MHSRWSRRRFLRIAGLAGGATAMSLRADRCPAVETSPPAWTWRGVALGADATIQLHGLPERKASRLTRACFAELRRFERLFSLYDPDSAVCRLNRQGHLGHPPRELVRLLQDARAFSEQTRGLFDISVQPLWAFLRDHYARAPEAAPPAGALRDALARVDYRRIRISRSCVAFEKPGMAITLNGIAQGWITDRIVDHLRREGVTSTLVNIGEYRALGSHPDNRPWQLGVRGPGEPGQPGGLLDIVPLENAALAVSGGHGHPFAERAPVHHLLHPRTGRSQPAGRTIAISAPTATEADALSTACAVVRDEEARALVAGRPVTIRLHS